MITRQMAMHVLASLVVILVTITAALGKCPMYSDPVPENGGVVCYGDKTYMPFCLLKCDQGFDFDGRYNSYDARSAFYECQYSGWQQLYDGKPYCKTLASLGRNIRYHPDEYMFESTCDELINQSDWKKGHDFNGLSPDYVMCSSGNPFPKCRDLTPDDFPANGNMTCTSRNDGFNSQSCRVGCSEGYRIAHGKTDMLHCDASSQYEWDFTKEDAASMCVPTKCRSLTKNDAPVNGGLQCHSMYDDYDEICTAMCNDGYDHEARPIEYEFCSAASDYEWSFSRLYKEDMVANCIKEKRQGLQLMPRSYYFPDTCQAYASSVTVPKEIGVPSPARFFCGPICNRSGLLVAPGASSWVCYDDEGMVKGTKCTLKCSYNYEYIHPSQIPSARCDHTTNGDWLYENITPEVCRSSYYRYECLEIHVPNKAGSGVVCYDDRNASMTYCVGRCRSVDEFDFQSIIQDYDFCGPSTNYNWLGKRFSSIPSLQQRSSSLNSVKPSTNCRSKSSSDPHIFPESYYLPTSCGALSFDQERRVKADFHDLLKRDGICGENGCDLMGFRIFCRSQFHYEP